jgi:hypothetical protein
MVASYACVLCQQHFTRHYSARRHNSTVHNNTGQIVPIIEYMAGLSSGRYPPGDRTLQKRRWGRLPGGHNSKSSVPSNIIIPPTPMVRDSMGDITMTC